MKNLKKTLAVVLAFAMVFSMGIINTFAAFSDVEAGTVVDEAVGILSNLKILEGFEDGTFKPEETVTRAQMAAIICRTLGYESQAQSSKGTTAFTDVAADSWASGYINVAQAQGIINGYGNGMFGPNDKVTYEQAVKMIVAALGYDIVAAAKGGYPTGYLAIASSEGITKNANGRVGDAALRSTVAVLVYNSLEVLLMDQNSWSTDGSDTYGKTTDTILSKYLGVDKVEGTLAEDMFTTFAAEYEEGAVERITLADATYNEYTQVGNTISKTEKDYTAKGVNASLVDTTGLLGKQVVAYIGNYDDPETDEPMVYAINEKSGSNETVTINATQIATVNDTDDVNDANLIYYKAEGKSKLQKLELSTDDKKASDIKVYLNYTKKETKDLDVTSTAKLAGVLANGGIVEFVSNDRDDEFEIVIIRAYDEHAVVKEVVEDEGVFEYATINTAEFDEIDTTDEDSLFVVYKDGVLAEAKDIEAGNTVSPVIMNDNFVIYYVSSKSVTGSVDSYESGKPNFTINGEEYSHFNPKFNAKDYAGEEGIFYLNVDGKVVAADTDSVAGGTYGVVLAFAQGTDWNKGEYEVRVALADGTVDIYSLASNAKFGDAKGDDAVAAALATAIGADVQLAGKSDKISTPGASATVQYDEIKKALFKFIIKDGTISTIKTVNDIDKIELSDAKDEFDAADNSYGKIDFAEDAVVFAFGGDYDDAVDVATNKVSVGEISAYFADEEDNKLFYPVYTDDDDELADILLGFNLLPGVPENGNVVVITSTSTVTYNDEEVVRIKGIQAGEEVTYTLYAGEDNNFADSETDGNAETSTNKEKVYNNPDYLAKGDVIIISNPSAEGIVSNYRLIYSRTAKKIDDKTTVAGDDIPSVTENFKKSGIFTVVSDLTDVNDKRFFLKDNVTNKLDDPETFAASGAGIKFGNACYTLVDYTDGKSLNPEIKKTSAAKALKVDKLTDEEIKAGKKPEYVSKVLVRVYDDELVDVVVYRTDYTE